MSNWTMTIINETKDGVLVSAPNGDTQWITKEDYEKMKASDEKH
jgi:hypothetical protein